MAFPNPLRRASEPAPQTPLWWLNKLYADLRARQTQMQLYDDYYCGDHPLPFLTKAHNAKMRDEFRMLLEDSRSNFMRLVVDAVEERLQVEGFRLSANSDPVADQESWEIWQANQMDSESSAAFVEALVKGLCYISVWAPEKEGGYPSIAVEDPTQTIVGYVPGSNFRERASALKVWTDDWTGKLRANVWMPDGIYKFQSNTDADAQLSLGDKPTWVELDNQFAPNPLGDVVAMVPLRNRPRLLWEGESEIADQYRTQAQINGFLFLLALAGYFGAHRQRWAVGVKLMYDEQTGKPIEPWNIGVDKLIVDEDPNVKFGEFDQTDLTGYIKAIEQKVLHIAVTSRTPRHYLVQEGQSPSGDAIKSAESGLVRKVERKQRPFGEGLEEVMRLARRFNGNTDNPPDSEIVWADANTESEAVITDAVVKQYAEGLIPWEAALERLGYSQTQIRRYAGLRAKDALLKQILDPPTATVLPEQIQA